MKNEQNKTTESSHTIQHRVFAGSMLRIIYKGNKILFANSNIRIDCTNMIT